MHGALRSVMIFTSKQWRLGLADLLCSLTGRGNSGVLIVLLHHEQKLAAADWRLKESKNNVLQLETGCVQCAWMLAFALVACTIHPQCMCVGQWIQLFAEKQELRESQAGFCALRVKSDHFRWPQHGLIHARVTS